MRVDSYKNFVSTQNFESMGRHSANYYLIRLVAKVALAIFIVPVFFESYRNKLIISYLKFKISKSGADSYLSKVNKARNVDFQKFAKKVESLGCGPAFGKVQAVPGKSGLWMPGVGIAVSYLTKKTKTQNIFSCLTVEAFQKKLNEIVNSTHDYKCALILPLAPPFLSPNVAQHKATIGVEKKGNNLKIVHLEPQPQPIEKISLDNCLTTNLWENNGKEDGYSLIEFVLRAILQVSFKQLNTQIYTTETKREGSYGCTVFALRDAVEFMRDNTFFDSIKVSSNNFPIKKDIKLEIISILPPVFMRGTQSIEKLKTYQRENPSVFSQKFPNKNKTLFDSLRKSCINVKGKVQNHYVSWKTYKYSKLVFDFVKKSSKSKIKNVFNSFIIK